MAFSYVTRSGNGTQKSFTFSFEGQDEGYIREEDLIVTVGGVSTPFTLTSSNTLELATAPPVGEDNVLIRRVMPKDVPYADFQRGNNFGQEVLNNSFLQLLYVVHELLDGYYPGGFTSREAVNFLKGLSVGEDLEVSGEATVQESDPSNPKSVVNFEKADTRFVNVNGDTMQGSLNVNIPVSGTEASRKDQLDKEISDRKLADSAISQGYQNGDSNIQEQLTGNVPLEASAFSPISWHDQSVDNSVTIPDNKNAWSFGPTVEVSLGQSVTIGDGSFWTIANGVQQ